MERRRIIIDTNLWISLLIGKRLSELRFLCNNDSIAVYFCEELKREFIQVASRGKIEKYVTKEHIMRTLELMEASCTLGVVKHTAVSSTLRDAKDLYLLALAEAVQADYILTGDKDLLVLQHHRQTKIVTFAAFMTLYK